MYDIASIIIAVIIVVIITMRYALRTYGKEKSSKIYESYYRYILMLALLAFVYANYRAILEW